MASKRTFGCGCRIRAVGIKRIRSGRNRAPSHPATLAPTAERTIPTPDDFVTECLKTIKVAGNCVIVEIALNDRPQPPPDLCDGLVPPSPKLLLQLSQFRRESLVDRLAFDDEPTGFPGPPAHMREAQKVERLRFALAGLPPYFGSIAPKLNQARLVRMQF